MAFTVTATESGPSLDHGVALLIRVLTNAKESGGASDGHNSLTGATASGSLTPNFSSSYIAFSLSVDNISTGVPAAAANNTYDLNTGNGANVWSTAQGHYTGTVTASTPITYGAGSAGAADHSNWCAYEIQPSGGTITLDGSSPAGVLSGAGLASGTAATTASFNPPAGSVLVAEVCAGATGTGAGLTMTITDTSGTGMVWTLRAVSNSSDNFQPTWIFTATVPQPQTPVDVPPRIAPWDMPGLSPGIPGGSPWMIYPPPDAGQPAATQPADFPLPQVAPFLPVGPGHPAGEPFQQYPAPTPAVPIVQNPYPAGIGGSGYNSWIKDQNGNPILMLLEQAWMLPTNAGRWNGGQWQSDFTAYFETRAAQGYNAWYGIPWNNTHIDSGALSGGRTWDGIYPFLVNGVAGPIVTGAETIALNNPFWQRIDALFQTALIYGVTCFLNVSQSYDISSVTGVWHAATNTQGTAFGNALATRYPISSYPNVQWFWGDDDDGPNDSFYQAILTGMQNAGDTRPLISDEQFTNTNCHIEFDNGTAFGGTFGVPNATYNWVYSYDVPYFGVEDSYKEGGTFPHLIPVYGDGIYYGDVTGSGISADLTIRNYVWWALSSGARGVCSTSGPSDIGAGVVWQWQSGASAALRNDPNGNGTWTTQVVGAIRSFFQGLTNWNKLIPDVNNVFITAGRGTRGTCDAPGGVFDTRPTNNYVSGSITPDGTLAVLYCKAAMSITIDQTKLGPGYTATWVDPSSLATQAAATGSTYNSTPLGNNSAGNPDWVLVFQSSTPLVSAITALTVKAPPRVVQRQPRQRVLTGMLPGKGLSGIPPIPILRDRQAPLVPIRTWLNRVVLGSRFPPVYVPVLRSAPPRVVQRQPKMQVRTGMLPGTGLSGIPPMQATQLRRPRLQVRAKGTVTGPLAPGAVAVVAPIRPVILVTPKRGPPLVKSRLLTGMLPGKGLSGLPPTTFTRPRQAPFVRIAPRQYLRTGMLPGVMSWPARIIAEPAHLVRAPRMQLRTGMLPGAGLSGIPPAGPVRARNARLVVQPRQRLLTSGFVQPAGTQPVQPFPAQLRRIIYRLVRQPPQRLTTGMLPGKGLSGIPPSSFLYVRKYAPLQRKPADRLRTGMTPGTGLSGIPPLPVLRDRQPPLVPIRLRNQVIPGYLPAPVQQARIRITPARLQRAPRQQLKAGFLPAPVQQARRLSLPYRLQRQPRQGTRPVPFVPAVVYPNVIQQAKLRSIFYRLMRRDRGRIISVVVPAGPPKPLLDPILLGGTITQDATAGTMVLNGYTGTIALDNTYGTITRDTWSGTITLDNSAGTMQ